jgi:hypothetical protein
MAYATVADIRQYLNQLPADVADDALLATILERANGIVNDYLTFSFAAWGTVATSKDVLRTVPALWLPLPAHKAGTVPAPITVSSLSGRGTTGESTVLVTDWLEEDDGRLYRDSGWSVGWYRVSAIWGYGPAPQTVVEVELRVAVNIWKGRDASQWQADLGVEGQGSVTYSRALTGSERSILDAVRLQYIGVVHA